MEKMNAMNYEYLIRRVYQVGRYGKPEADADVFREYERTYAYYNSEKELKRKGLPKQRNQSIAELKSEYEKKSGEISFLINKTLDYFLKKKGLILTTKHMDKIMDCKNRLKNPEFNVICQAIDEAQSVMVELEIYPA